MLATVVTPSLNALQVFALIAVILFIVAAVYGAVTRAFVLVILAAGLAFLALAVLFGG